MSDSNRYVIFDVNFFQNLRLIDPDCSLVEFICDCYEGTGVCDPDQLRQVDYCPNLCNIVGSRTATDEDTAAFIMQHNGLDLATYFKDPVDVRLLAFAKNNPDSVLLSCDKRILVVAAMYRLERACFKAAIHKTNDCFSNAVFTDPSYATQPMRDGGIHPFFHYGNDKHCPACDPSKNCSARRDI